jgi:hypothetical protein
MNELRRKVIALLGASLESDILADILIALILREAGRLGGRPRKIDDLQAAVVPKPVTETSQETPIEGGGGVSGSDSGSQSVLSLVPSGPSQPIRKDRRSNEPAAWPGFEESFWPAYPRKDAKAEARRAWNRRRPDLATCLAALEWQRKRPEWLTPAADGRSTIPLPASWINGERWNDERPAARRDPNALPKLA